MLSGGIEFVLGRGVLRRSHEHVGPDDGQELQAGTRDAVLAPAADRGLFDVAQARDGGRTPQGIDDVVGVHEGKLGVPIPKVNSESVSPAEYPFLMDTLADRLRAAMRAAGLNQKQLADACGVKPPSVNGWLSEKSKFLRGENLLRAAAALGVSDVWLATGKGEMNARWQAVQPVSPQSETVRLDAGIVATVAEAMRIWLARRAKTVDLTDPEQAELFAEAYAELSSMRATPSDLAAGAVVADLMAVREIGRGQSGSGAAGGIPGAARRGSK